jgi:hypothetical protein
LFSSVTAAYKEADMYDHEFRRMLGMLVGGFFGARSGYRNASKHRFIGGVGKGVLGSLMGLLGAEVLNKLTQVRSGGDTDYRPSDLNEDDIEYLVSVPDVRNALGDILCEVRGLEIGIDIGFSVMAAFIEGIELDPSIEEKLGSLEDEDDVIRLNEAVVVSCLKDEIDAHHERLKHEGGFAPAHIEKFERRLFMKLKQKVLEIFA